MRAESIKSKLFTRRAMLLGGLKASVFGILGARLQYLQIHQSDQYKTLSEENRIRLQLSAPPRGRIFDRAGNMIAANQTSYGLFYDMSISRDYQKQLQHLAEIIEISPEYLTEISLRLKKARRNDLIEIMDDLTWEQVTKLEVNRTLVPAIQVDVGLARIYPMGEKTAHLLGYLGAVAEGETKGKEAVYRLPDFKIGKNGLEKSYDESMHGEPGVKKLEVDVHGTVIREISSDNGRPGNDFISSIHAELQNYCYDLLGEESGSVVVMDVHTGEVMAFVSKPGFDSTQLSRSIRKDYWDALVQDKTGPLLNKVISGIYPPGSTFKMMTALAGLESGKINPKTSFFCPGFVDFGNHRFHCWKHGGHGTVSLKTAIAMSCDTYFYRVSMAIGIDPISNISQMFGYGHKTEIDLPGEKSGIMPSQEWKMKRYKQPWMGGETLSCAIGQGYVACTPMQLAHMTAMLANGGYQITPTVKKIDDPALIKKSAVRVNVNPENLLRVLEGMYASTNEPYGTAYNRRIMNPEMAMAGKTGTAQVKTIARGAGGKSIKENRKEFKHHAWYTGFAPYNNPRFAVAVLVEHGESGSAAAAPIARDALTKCMELMKEPVEQ